MLVVGSLQIDWQNGTPHLTVNAEKAGRTPQCGQRPVGKPGKPTHRSAAGANRPRCMVLASTKHTTAISTTAIPHSTGQCSGQQLALRLGAVGRAIPLYQPTKFAVHFDSTSIAIGRYGADDPQFQSPSSVMDNQTARLFTAALPTAALPTAAVPAATVSAATVSAATVLSCAFCEQSWQVAHALAKPLSSRSSAGERCRSPSSSKAIHSL